MPRKIKRTIRYRNAHIEVISEKDRIGNHLSNILIHILALFILIAFIAPFISFILFGSEALFVSCILFLIASTFYKLAFQNRQEINFYNLINSIVYVSKNSIIHFILLTIFNIFIVLKFGFQTLIPTTFLILVFFLVIVLVYHFVKDTERKYFNSIVLAPLALNFLLLINYTVSFDEKQEFYQFTGSYDTVINSNHSGVRIQQSTLITLKDNAYNKYYGIRMFLRFEEVVSANSIRYTFKKGILGFRVMTDYSFQLISVPNSN